MALAGEPRRVERTIDQRLKLEKNDHSAMHTLGLMAVRQQNLSKADKLMREALTLDLGNQEYLADLGDLALRRRKPDKAKAYYEQAWPDNPQVVLGLARASELLGDKDRAAILYDQAVDMPSAPYPEALELSGRFFYQEGQKAKGHYYLGRYFVSVGNVNKAVLNFQEASAQPEAGRFRTMAEQEADHLSYITKDDQK